LVLIAILGVLIAAAVVFADEDLGTDVNELMKPVVRVERGPSRSTGMIIHPNAKGKAYVLTVNHGIDDSLDEPVVVVFFEYEDGGREVIARRYEAEVVATEAELDLALLRIDVGDEKLPAVRLASPGRKLRLLEKVRVVGCPLGKDPVVSDGEVTDLEHELDGQKFVMTSAGYYLGNSGGPVFVKDDGKWYVVGMMARSEGFRCQLITYMGYAIPVSRIHTWLLELTRKMEESIDG
jgi:S1-C subfamily serine protease